MERENQLILFLCTGNYYRSRFAEAYFRHLASNKGLPWHVDSAGLRMSGSNVGPLSIHAQEMCHAMGINAPNNRLPRLVQTSDLERATLTIAVKESEHRPLMRARFPEWENRVEYWDVHDIDVSLPSESLPRLCVYIDQLIGRLQR